MTIRDIGILFGYKVDQASEQKVEGSIKSLKSMASKVLGAVGITLSVAGIKSAIDGCVEVASSVEEMQNKFDVVFGDMRDEVDKWAQEYSDAIGRNKNDIKTYLADQQNLLVGFGMTRQAGAEMAEQMTSLALDLASFGNMDETASVNAMTKAVMGESEAAKTLGAVLNDSTRAQAMATLGLKGTYDKLDQLTKMQVNYQAILQQSPDAIGDCQRSLDSYESTKKRYIAKLKEIKTIVGQFFLPTYQKILSIGAKGLTMIRDWLQKLTDSDAQQKIHDELVYQTANSEDMASVRALKENLGQIRFFVSSVGQYADGVAAAAEGAHTAKEGSAQLAGGASALYEGVLQLQNGTDQLNGGLVQFNAEGISQLTGALDADQLHALQAVVEEMTSRLAGYTSFAGAPEGAEQRVKFIYKTGETVAATENAAETTTTVEEGNFFTRLWQRIVNLFKF